MRIIACDVGGTEIKGALFNNEIVEKTFALPTDQTNGKDSIMNTLFNVIKELLLNDIERIGIVSAGAIDPKTGMIVGNSGTMKGWLNFSIKEEVEKVFNIPCFVENDANGAMIAEFEFYQEKGINNAVMITLGTGVGTSVIIDGKLYHGATNHVEFGHTVLHPNGKLCTCGIKGCAEAHISGTAFTKMANEMFDNEITHGKQVIDLFKNNNKKAIKLLNDYVEDILLFLHNLNRTFDPSVFIIGGGVSNSKEVFIPLLEKKQKETVVNKPIEFAKLGNFAGIKGAYLLALKGE